MDWVKKKEDVLLLVNKYKYILIILLMGVILLLTPEKQEPIKMDEADQIQTNVDLQEALTDILKKVEGAGDVAVLLTEKRGEEILYQMDENHTFGANTDTVTRKTLIVSDESRADKGLIRQINPPILQGAVVVCQGANDPKVKLAVVDAVMQATGLPSSEICVLKMK